MTPGHSILHLNTYGISGGAGKAAHRLHTALLSLGADSRYLAKTTPSGTEGVFAAPRDDAFEESLATDSLINKYYIWFNRTSLSNTYFSFSYPGYGLVENELVRQADIYNFHWVEDFLSPCSLNQLLSDDKPSVWTLHDQKPFTGGCHYSAGCANYENNCRACPQLAEDPAGLSEAIVNDKRELFAGADLTIVAPSRWLAGAARKSTLFKALRVEVIPNSVETDIYFPKDKAAAKIARGIDPSVTTIMFGSADATEKRKGFGHLLNALQQCLRDQTFGRLVEEGRILIICVGKADPAIESLSVPFMNAGLIESDQQMATLYNAADVFVLPSLEDNLPNTMLEAMACGTPVVAFDVGGIQDVIVDDRNGKLVVAKDDRLLAKAILEMVCAPEMRRMLAEAASRTIHSTYRLLDQGNKYLLLYEELLDRHDARRRGARPFRGRYGSSTEAIYPRLLRYSLAKKASMERPPSHGTGASLWKRLRGWSPRLSRDAGTTPTDEGCHTS